MYSFISYSEFELILDADILKLLVGIEIPLLLVTVVSQLVVHSIGQRACKQILPVLKRLTLPNGVNVKLRCLVALVEVVQDIIPD